jgi:hypothetical protein
MVMNSSLSLRPEGPAGSKCEQIAVPGKGPAKAAAGGSVELDPPLAWRSGAPDSYGSATREVADASGALIHVSEPYVFAAGEVRMTRAERAQRPRRWRPGSPPGTA